MKGHFHLAQISTPIIWTLWEWPMLLINMNSSGLPRNKRFTYALKSFQEKYDFYRAFAEWKWFPLKIETMFITNCISISSLTVVLHVIWHFNRTSIRPLKNGFLIRLGTVLEYSEFQSYWTIEFQNLLKLWFRIIPRVPSKVAFFLKDFHPKEECGKVISEHILYLLYIANNGVVQYQVRGCNYITLVTS